MLTRTAVQDIRENAGLTLEAGRALIGHRNQNTGRAMIKGKGPLTLSLAVLWPSLSSGLLSMTGWPVSMSFHKDFHNLILGKPPGLIRVTDRNSLLLSLTPGSVAPTGRSFAARLTRRHLLIDIIFQ